ncbi:hypothetical protein IH992_18770 [Candidatus Poribacteria bacterium]|nr:hypothetical protein [Candidatus Poribacteria bacterium]
MAFTDFKSIQQVQEAFNIKYTEEDYVDFDDIEPSKAFLEEFEFSRQNIDVFSSEASRCENVIYPIIRDVYKHFVGKYALWSHKSISHNQVLSGTPDYIISTKSELGKTILGIPIIIVVEAKQNNFTEGWGQCLAELVAVQKINKNEEIPVHGIVTDGELWQFGKLVGNLFTKNQTVLAISEMKKVFGAISYLIRSSTMYFECRIDSSSI